MGGVTAATGKPDSRYILLTDIYQSSRLSELYPGQYAALLDTHNAAVEKTVGECTGQVYKNTGDGYIAFFDRAADCLACAVRLQREFSAFPSFGDDDPFLARVVAHGGVLRAVGDEYYSPALNRASRICQVCHPGQVLVSGAVAAQAEGRLPEATELRDLGEHHLRDLAEPEYLYQLNIPGLQQEFPALPTLGNRPNNLVAQPNAFIGRERELAELKALLLGSRRLVTITAPGGYGKSRLGAHLCADLLESFERGVFFVELAPVRDHTGIATALANATSFQFYGSRDPKEQLIDYLREKELLLCFDNFEHVLEGASFIGDILKEAPRMKAIVTSREPLRITGEQVYPLKPLPVDVPGQADEHYADAVLLFTDRALLVSPTFALDADKLEAIHDVCVRLSGIPLAIELAAAWTDSFTLSELRDELDRQLELTARLSDVPKRHRSLRASLDWSWNLLSEEQQRMLMQLSTFRGGCFVEAAALVLSAEGLTLRQGLSSLADKSWLLSREVDGLTRFFIRDAASHEYAFEKLRETRTEGVSSPYEQAAMDHARYFSGLMEREGKRLHGHGQLEALQRVRREQQNVYEALDTLLQRLSGSGAGVPARDLNSMAGTEARPTDSLEPSPSSLEPSLLLPIARWLWEYLDMTSAYRELVERYQVLKDAAGQAGNMEQILLWASLGCGRGQWRLGDNDAARSDASRAGDFAKTLGNRHGSGVSLLSLGLVEYSQGNYDAARELYAQSLASEREVGSHHGTAFSLNCLGLVEYSQGNYEAARELHAESLAIRREIGDRRGIAVSLNNLGVVEYNQGNCDAARELYAESLAIDREIGDRRGIAGALHNLGLLDYRPGNYEAARELHAESLAIRREIGDRRGIAESHNRLGLVEYSEGNYSAARDLYAQSLVIKREIGDRRGIAVSLHNLGLVEYRQGNCDAAREQYAESLAVEREIGDSSGICESIAATGCLLATSSHEQAAAICLYGARFHATQLGYTFEPLEHELLEQGLAVIENPESGLPSAERERLKAQAEAMSLDELAAYTLDALKKLELG